MIIICICFSSIYKQYITVYDCCQLFYTVILYILSNESAYPCSLITSHFDLQTKNISTDKKKDGFGYKIFQIYLSSYQILNPHCYVSLHRITALQGPHLIRLKNCFYVIVFFLFFTLPDTPSVSPYQLSSLSVPPHKSPLNGPDHAQPVLH